MPNYGMKKGSFNIPIKVLFSENQLTGQLPISQEAIVWIIETFYEAQLRFVVKNDRLDPDLKITD